MKLARGAVIRLTHAEPAATLRTMLRSRAVRLGRLSALLGTLLGSTLLAGCPARVGGVCSEADLDEARLVAYAADGMPAYEGQALLIASCGGASYCHTQTPDAPRFGAPGDLVFDVLPIDGASDEVSAQRALLRATRSAYRHRDGIYASVVTETMPPAGRPPVPDLRAAAAAFVRADGMPLPEIQSELGREILRNWLACGAPVVERTTAPSAAETCNDDADCPITGLCDPLAMGAASRECRPVGDIVAARPIALEPTWTSIFANVIRPSCATVGCHAGATSANMLDLSNAADAYAALTTRDSSATCGSAPYVTAGDPSGSALIDKLRPTQTLCAGSSRMPPSGLSAATVAVIEEWVMRGAMND